MPVEVQRATPQALPAAVLALGEQGLLERYRMEPAQLLKLVLGAQAAGDIVLLAARPSTPGEALCPCGLAWGMARGAFASAGYLRLLLVAQHAWGVGAGRALLAAFEAECLGPKGGYFALTEAEVGAEGFYLKQGYRAVGVLPGFVRPERTELLLWKGP